MVTDREAATALEKLLAYGRQQGLLEEYDSITARNRLLDKLNLDEPATNHAEGLPRENIPSSPVSLLDILVDYALEENIIERDTRTCRDLFDTELMGALMPRQSEVVEKFWSRAEEDTIRDATDYFYHLSRKSNYIREKRIEKNSRWRSETECGELEITINLAKPEKDPDEIAAASQEESGDYPRCPLCVENAGYPGRLDHPARHNLRVIPMELGGEEWFMQYSPYVYYQEHCIVLSARHEEMRIGRETFARLLEFLDTFPHYFIGSNADLPLVGGSILNHDHFQGGRYEFPMERAPVVMAIEHRDYSNLEAGVIDWPMSALRLKSSSTEELIEAAFSLHQSWQQYSDPERKILSHSSQEGEEVRHNTVTPIARYRQDEEKYELDLVLRNNRRSQEHPEGIFHPHRPLHHIKKENIGLIEVMGMAVLPGRLKQELEALCEVLTGSCRPDRLEKLEQERNLELKKHADWLEELMAEHGRDNSREQAEAILRQETAAKFCRVLEDAGVFKNTDSGRRGMEEFLRQAGWKINRCQGEVDSYERK